MFDKMTNGVLEDMSSVTPASPHIDGTNSENIVDVMFDEETSPNNDSALQSHYETLPAEVPVATFDNTISNSSHFIPIRSTSSVVSTISNMRVNPLLDSKHADDVNTRDNVVQMVDFSPLRYKTNYPIDFTSQGYFMLNVFWKLVNIGFSFDDALWIHIFPYLHISFDEFCLGNRTKASLYLDFDLHKCIWVDTGQEYILPRFLWSYFSSHKTCNILDLQRSTLVMQDDETNGGELIGKELTISLQEEKIFVSLYLDNFFWENGVISPPVGRSIGQYILSQFPYVPATNFLAVAILGNAVNSCVWDPRIDFEFRPPTSYTVSKAEELLLLGCTGSFFFIMYSNSMGRVSNCEQSWRVNSYLSNECSIIYYDILFTCPSVASTLVLHEYYYNVPDDILAANFKCISLVHLHYKIVVATILLAWKVIVLRSGYEVKFQVEHPSTNYAPYGVLKMVEWAARLRLHHGSGTALVFFILFNKCGQKCSLPGVLLSDMCAYKYYDLDFSIGGVTWLAPIMRPPTQIGSLRALPHSTSDVHDKFSSENEIFIPTSDTHSVEVLLNAEHGTPTNGCDPLNLSQFSFDPGAQSVTVHIRLTAMDPSIRNLRADKGGTNVSPVEGSNHFWFCLQPTTQDLALVTLEPLSSYFTITGGQTLSIKFSVGYNYNASKGLYIAGKVYLLVLYISFDVKHEDPCDCCYKEVVLYQTNYSMPWSPLLTFTCMQNERCIADCTPKKTGVKLPCLSDDVFLSSDLVEQMIVLRIIFRTAESFSPSVPSNDDPTQESVEMLVILGSSPLPEIGYMGYIPPGDVIKNRQVPLPSIRYHITRNLHKTNISMLRFSGKLFYESVTFSSLVWLYSNLEDKVLNTEGGIVVNKDSPKTGQTVGPWAKPQTGPRIRQPNNSFAWDPG